MEELLADVFIRLLQSLKDFLLPVVWSLLRIEWMQSVNILFQSFTTILFQLSVLHWSVWNLSLILLNKLNIDIFRNLVKRLEYFLDSILLDICVLFKTLNNINKHSIKTKIAAIQAADPLLLWLVLILLSAHLLNSLTEK